MKQTRLAAPPQKKKIGRLRGVHGQTTAEYALVLLGVAAIAMAVLAWAGQTDAIGQLFDSVLQSILGMVP